MGKRILVVQNASCETPGTLQPLFEQDGFITETIIASLGEGLPSGLDGYRALIILGGPAGVHDEQKYLRDEDRLIRIALAEDIPALGICLGSQLIAKAAGARLYKGPKKEIGWYPVTITDEGLSDIFNGLLKDVTVFQWHGDTYDTLPGNTVTLARSELYPVQAFRIANAFGIQFHLEVSKEMVKDWINEYKTELESVRNYIRVDDIIGGLDANAATLNGYAKVLYRNFSRLIK